MRLLRSLEAILVSVGLIYCVSVDGTSESLRASLQLTYKQRINETVGFFQFLSENFVHDIVGMSIDKMKLEIPRNPDDMATVNDTKGQDLLRVGRCSLQLSFQEEEGGELTVTGEHINELSIDQEQREILLCAFVTIPILSEGSREYRTPTLVISTADPKWKTSSCENMTDSVCSEFNSTTKLTTSSKIFGSGKCCTIGLKIAYPLRIIQIFIITNQTEWLSLVSGRNARKGSAENENLFFVGEIPAIFKIVIVYEEEMSASFSIFWKNCNTIKRAISTTLSGWNYNVTDFTIYDEFCDCNEALLQPFYCDGPSKGLVLQTAGNLATITSEMITSSNPECYLSLVMTTTFRTYAGVTILSKNRTKFRVFSENREGGLYNHHSKEYRIKVGQIKEDFKIQVDLQRLQPSSLMAVGSIALNNCTGPHSFDSNCSSSEYMCKTGVCISKWKRCNIAKDCYHGDDEEHCGREISPWHCDFDDMPNSTCNFLQYENDKCGQFKVTEGRLFGHPGPEHTNTHDRGAMLYFQRNFCKKPFSAEIRTQLFEYTLPEKQENKSKCTLSIASKGENSCWWNLYLCQDSSCTRKLFRGNTTGIWRTDVVTLNLMSGSYYIKLKAKERCEWMAIDDVFFSPNCFSPEPEDLDITWWVEIFVPFVCLIVLIEIIVVSWAVCQKFSVCQKSVFLEKFYFLRSRKNSDMKDFLGDRCVLPNSTSRFKDMLTEDNPNYALLSERTLNECIRNIPFTSVCLESLLGEGSFGQVYKGKLIKHGETKEDLPIAIKKLPAGSFNENISDFLLEALTLGKFDHKNIVRCLGITSDPRGELLLILELMEGGDLRKYLRSHRQKEDLTIKELLKISLDIALGCQYLEENKFIHRDIAARNCLLSSTDSNKIAKIGDFGFAKDIYGTDYYKKSELTMVPVRWMPEESFKNGKFTSKSDVWAFGVLLWEVFSFGQLPYEDLTNCEVMAKVMNGHRLGQPKLCPIQLYTLMGDCWNTEPEKRPCFKTIVTIFTTLYTHSYAQSALTSNGICSLKVNGGKHRLNTYDEVDNAIPLLEGDCTIVSTTDDSVFEATIPV